MLCGRGPEQRRIDAALVRARAGRGGTVVLRGEPGIGKTALCAYAQASAGGMRVLSARGLESESALAHVGLFDVLHGIRDQLPALPPAQRDALAAVLRIEDSPIPDPLTVGVAALSLLAAAAAEHPLLVVVDDLQWVDSASRSALRFAARRLAGDSVAFVVAVRDDGEHELHDGHSDVVDLAGLDVTAVAELIEQRRGTPIAARTAERVVALTGGNPLAVQELGDALSDAELRGDVRLDPIRVARLRAHEHIRDRLEALPDGTRTALLLCGLGSAAGIDRLVAALEVLGRDRTDLHAAEASGLVDLDATSAVFRHPLVRAAAVGSASASERRAAHRALASTALTEAEQVWHRAEAAEGADREIAAALEALAVEDERVGAHAEAVRAWDRAVALTPTGDDVARRLLGAGRARHLTGRSAEALPLLDQALVRAADPSTRLAIQQERGHILVWQGQPEVVHRTFLEEARRSAGDQPFLAASAFVLATLGALQAGNLGDAEEAAAAAHAEAAAVGGLLETMTAAIHGLTRCLRGDFEGEEPMLALDGCAEVALPMADVVPATLGLLSWAGLMLSIVEAHAAAEQLLGATVAFARERRAVAALPAPLVNLAELRMTVGDWESAAAFADEALQLAEATGDAGHRLRALIALGQLEGLRGGHERADEMLVEAVALARQHRLRSYEVDAEAALGLGALGAGELPAALRHLLRAAELADEGGLRHPHFARFVPDLVETHLRSGDGEAAAAALAPYEWDASQSLGERGSAAAARCRGMLAHDGWEQHFEVALKHHRAVPIPFERARTELAYGERLRRTGERRRARRHLRSSLATFEQLGAGPWARRASDELRASGEHMSSNGTRTGAGLTPQELRIARSVSLGHTNREVAADLFVSPKTVENQLTRIYAKLGVRSRTELAARMAAEQGRSAVP